MQMQTHEGPRGGTDGEGRGAEDLVLGTRFRIHCIPTNPEGTSVDKDRQAIKTQLNALRERLLAREEIRINWTRYDQRVLCKIQDLEEDGRVVVSFYTEGDMSALSTVRIDAQRLLKMLVVPIE